MSTEPSVTLIATVKNERRHLDAWLQGIEHQTRLPDEIVIVDGGSTDGTWEKLAAWEGPCPIKRLQVHDVSISGGRNIAMAHATGEILAITDCGTVAYPDWLQHLIEPFQDVNTDVVSGFFTPHQSNVWDRSLAAATLPDINEIDPDTFLPSSRSVAVRSAWIRRGFEYPEWLDYCEDLIWDLQLKRAGARFQFQPRALVTFTVRDSWQAFFKQYYRYARGDGKAGLFGKRHFVRYATYVTAAIVIERRKPLELATAGVLAGMYVARPAYRLARRGSGPDESTASTLAALGLIPIHRFVGDVAKMLGYPVGLLWRWRTYGTLSPFKNWQRINPAGDLWRPSSPAGAHRRQAR